MAVNLPGHTRRPTPMELVLRDHCDEVIESPSSSLVIEHCPRHRRRPTPMELIIRDHCDGVIQSPSSSLVVENAMENTYDRLAEEAIDKYKELNKLFNEEEKGEDNERPTLHHRRLWIGLAGAPGSGKSTVGEEVASRICNSGVSATVVSMDGWHHTQATLRELNMDMRRKGAPWTIDAQRMLKDLSYAKDHHDKAASFPAYDRNISDPVNDKVYLDETHEIVIVEGLYLLLGFLAEEGDKLESGPLHDEIIRDLECPYDVREEIERWRPITRLWDLTWFVEPPAGFEENKKRLIKRSLKTWTPEKTLRFGGGTDEEAATRRVEENDAKNGKLVSYCKRFASVHIDSL